MTYVLLSLAIVFEVGWALAMKASAGLTKPRATAALVVMYVLSVVFLALATKKLDVGVAYAIWAGSGVALIAICAVFLFNEPMTLAKAASIGLIGLGIVGLQLSGGGHAAVGAPAAGAQGQETP